MNLGLFLASAALLILVFPRFELWWLAPIALTPILVACGRENSWRGRFLSGWLAGSLFWGCVCYWIQFVLEVHGGMGFWGGWGTFLLFALYKGLHLGVFSMLAGFLMPKPWAVPAVAALWTGIERTHGPLAFAWLDLGNAAIHMPLALRLAAFVGVYGMSFVFAATGCSVALLAGRYSHGRKSAYATLAIFPLLLLLPGIPEPSPGTATAQVVQPNIDTEASWTVESLRDLEQRLAALSRAPGANVIVWPEAPAPFYPASPEFRSFIGSIAQASHAPFLLSAVPRTPKGDPMNSAILVEPTGDICCRYDKVNLVPFGEYVPSMFNFVNKITSEAGDFVPGERVVTLPLDGHAVGVFICYESAFPDFVRQFALGGGEAMMNLSNDGYFGGGAGREQHLSLVRMRAVENRRWILRATNDGITAMVDPGGRITNTLPEYKQIAGSMRYGYVAQTTFYTRHGDWFAWGCLIAGLALTAMARFR